MAYKTVMQTGRTAKYTSLHLVPFKYSYAYAELKSYNLLKITVVKFVCM